MAKRYTSTVQVVCLKQHTCAGCGTNYSYILSRKAVGTAGSAEGARKAMQKRVTLITGRETDMQPCPGCGLYQHDMIAQRRTKSRLQFFWIALVGFAAVLIVRANDLLQTNALTAIAAVVALLMVLAHLLLETKNVNSDLAANVALAQQRVGEGKLKHAPGEPLRQTDALARPSRSVFHLLALLLLVVSIVAVVMPELVRSVRGWPLNAECYPPVVGATDHTRVYMPDSISSIKGFWRGSAAVVLHYDGGPTDGVGVAAETNQNNWGLTINDVDSGAESKKSHPWVEMTLPDDSALSGKTVGCDIDLSLDYPQMQTGSTFRTISDQMRHHLTIRLATAGAGQQYNTLWWSGTAGGGGLILLASLMLWAQAKAFGRLAKATQVFAVPAPAAAPG